MKKTWFNFFMCLFVLLFAGLWISGSVAEARSKGMKKRGHHRHHYPYRVDVPKIVAVAGGGSHTIELKSDGTVWAWGDNQYGQLGATTSETCVSAPYYNYPCSTTPIQVSGLTDVIAIAAGGNYYFDSSGHSIALKSDGTVWAWGENRYGHGGVVASANWATERCMASPPLLCR